MNPHVTSFVSSLILGLALILVGCETHPFSGSTAMRIDVEVYKGPLS